MENVVDQVAWYHNGETLTHFRLPDAARDVMPGVKWGSPDEVFSPAFWKYQALVSRPNATAHFFRIGENLFEELSVCLLGGFGMPAELGIAAFQRLRDAGKLDGTATAAELEALLSIPFIQKGSNRRYRFPRQKAAYLSSALRQMLDVPPPTDPLELRNYLTSLKGVGPKTASWVVRNHFSSDAVAILDVHIIRACQHIGLFSPALAPARDYTVMERLFLSFCDHLEESASLMDAVMWDVMRRIGPTSRTTTIQLA